MWVQVLGTQGARLHGDSHEFKLNGVPYYIARRTKDNKPVSRIHNDLLEVAFYMTKSRNFNYPLRWAEHNKSLEFDPDKRKPKPEPVLANQDAQDELANTLMDMGKTLITLANKLRRT